MEGASGQITSFGELVKQYRKRKKVTQRQLAVQLGVHYNSIWAWERGDHLPETRGMVLELARHLALNDQDTRHLLEASLTAVPLTWTVPYTRNPFFTGREEVFQVLHKALHPSHIHRSHSCTLSGLGGIGKTHLAVEYAYRSINEYTAIFWISAETRESIISSFIAIAAVLNLPEAQEQNQERLIAAVKRWLVGHHGWLMIFDNVDDVIMLKGFLPLSPQSSLLLITRGQPSGLTGHIVNLEPITQEESLRFLLARSRRPDLGSSIRLQAVDEVSMAQRIIEAMDGLPLALDQAGAYLEATQCSLFDYVQLFQIRQHQLLSIREPYADHPLSVTGTFTLAFEQLERANPQAAELLTGCAFLSAEAIPDRLFLEGGAPFEILMADPLAFQALLKALLSYSLIQRTPSTRTITVHRLVQAVLKNRLSEEDQRIWLLRMLQVLAFLFPTETNALDYWEKSEQLLPHALLCLEQSERWEENNEIRLSLMIHVSTFLAFKARTVEADALFQRALYLGKRNFGEEHPLVIEALHGLAMLYSSQGRSSAGLQRRERLFRSEHSVLIETHN